MKKRMLSAVICICVIAQTLVTSSMNVFAATDINEIVDTWGYKKALTIQIFRSGRRQKGRTDIVAWR